LSILKHDRGKRHRGAGHLGGNQTQRFEIPISVLVDPLLAFLEAT
jgi:hypothetical protein